MKKSIFEGKQIKLRAVNEEDWQAFAAMDENSETARASYLIPFPRSPQAARQWTKETSLQAPKNDEFRFAIEALDQSKVVGTLNTHSCDARNGTFSYGLAIQEDFRKKGYATEAIWLTLNYYFTELRYQKCTTGVYSFNQASLALHDKFGFTREGCLRRMQFTNGEFFDHILFGITKEEFQEKYG